MSKVQFDNIHPILDKEHADIFKAIDNVIITTNRHWDNKKKRRLIVKSIEKLYKKCNKHWKTEEKYFKMGLKNMPPEHQEIEKKINKHRKKHIKMLDKIIKIQNKATTTNPIKSIVKVRDATIKHINTDDLEHFHWL
jgi:hemerythrin